MNQRDLFLCKLFIVVMNIVNIGIGLHVGITCILYMHEKSAYPEPSMLISRGVLAFFITLSLFMAVTGVLGCVATLKKHHKALYVQVCFYVFLLSVEIITAIATLLVHEWVGGTEKLRLTFYNNGTDEEYEGRQPAWDRLQADYRCCGFNGPRDYIIIQRDIPASCCASAYPLPDGGARRQLLINCIREHTYYTRGCEDAINKRGYSGVSDITTTSSLVLVIEVIIILASLTLMKHIRKHRRQLQQNLQAHYES